MKCLLILAALAVACQAALGQPAPPPGPPPDLAKYVAAPDASYKWAKVGDPVVTPEGAVHTLSLVSQTWHGFDWDHDVQIALPAGKGVGTTALLWNQGGKASATTAVLALGLANKARVPVVFVCGVPKQPLFGGKTEDALIAETFVRYLDTGDATWPLLFPMVKSVVRAMDAAQAFAKQELGAEFTHFVVTGASKRGWTSWLVGSLGDPRVKAIAPMVIDTLNFGAQMRNQVTAFGKPSEMIADYTRRGLVPIPDTERARSLWAMVDPWAYRSKLTVPKLIINGANDPYWPVEALSSYWNDLPGEKYLLVVPNAGHDLREKAGNGSKQLIPDRAVNALAAFVRAQAGLAAPPPSLPGLPAPPPPPVGVAQAPAPPFRVPSFAGWQGGQPVAEVVPQPDGGAHLRSEFPWPDTVWTADSPTRDFRQARWVGRPVERRLARVPMTSQTVAVPAPETGFRAAFTETNFADGDQKFTLSTPVLVLPAAVKRVGQAPTTQPDKPKP